MCITDIYSVRGCKYPYAKEFFLISWVQS
jgi:hypothetical protein